jgi:hypothetical protein
VCVSDSTQAVVLAKDRGVYRLLATNKKFGKLGCLASVRLAQAYAIVHRNTLAQFGAQAA